MLVQYHLYHLQLNHNYHHLLYLHLIRHFYEMRGNDEFTAFPVIPEEKLQIILSHIDENHCDVFINYLLGLCYKQRNPTKALQYFVHGVKEL